MDINGIVSIVVALWKLAMPTAEGAHAWALFLPTRRTQICGFVNTQGGKIYIGTRDDGSVIGIANSKKLLEDIMVKFKALQSAKVIDSKTPNRQSGVLDGTVELIITD